MQLVCLEVRRRNCGINGKPVLFYAKRFTPEPMKGRVRPATAAPKKDVAALMAGLNSLGLTTATAAQVEAITKELYPAGTHGKDQGEVLRAVFLRIRSQNTADNVVR